MKKAIAMKCTQEQFEAVKPKLKQHNLHFENTESDWSEWCYLKNNGVDNKKVFITNIPESWKSDLFRTVHETWNEQIFLEACGIEPAYTITKDQVQSLHRHGNSITKAFCMDTYPDCFEVKKELIVGRWYNVSGSVAKRLMQIPSKDEDNIEGYGFVDGCYNSGINLDTTLDVEYGRSWTEATIQEVTNALTDEAKKRGFVEGVYFIGCDGAEKNIPLKIDEIRIASKETSFDTCFGLYSGNSWIFKDGVWGSVVEVLTKQQAEEKLNCKIV